MIDINTIPYDDIKTWRLLSKGLTCGVFQLESNLGQYWCHRIEPSNINELSAVIALIRPACLESGMTERYSQIKHGEKNIDSFGDPDVDRILEPTLGTLIFQETLMKLGSDIAWKHLPELEKLVITDSLRKGVAKKQSKTLLNLKQSFVDGCVTNGKDEELATRLFTLIEKAGRYAFNNAHSTKYAHWSYKTAYLKANYPLEFYTTYMCYSKFKQKSKEELKSLIDEARVLGIHILPPNILLKNAEFVIINKKEKRIAFGLNHIKNVGKTDVSVISSRKIENWTELFLAHFQGSKKLRAKAVESLICCGACDIFGIPRNVLLNIFKVTKQLSNKELNFIVSHLPEMESIYDFAKYLEQCADSVSVKSRKDLVRSEAVNLDLYKKDTFTWRANQELNLLGLHLTCSAVDDKDIEICHELIDCNKLIDNKGMRLIINAVLDNFRTLKTKKGSNPGQKMAIMNVSDKTSSLKVACFPKEFLLYQDRLFDSVVYTLDIEGTGKNNWALKYLKQQ